MAEIIKATSYEEVLPDGVSALAVYTSGKNLVRSGSTATTGFWPMGRRGITKILVFLKSPQSNAPHEIWLGDLINAENTGKHPEGIRRVTKYKFHLKNYRRVALTYENFSSFCGAPRSSKQAIYIPRIEKRNWLYEARRIWPVLTRLAKNRKTAYYEDIAAVIVTNPLSVRLALDPIQAYCLETGRPPLTSLVVNKATGLPSEGFIAWEIGDIDAAHQSTFAYDWSAIANPFHGIESTDSIEVLASKLLKSKAEAEQTFAKVKSRGIFQQIFREAILKIYEGQCAFCDISIEDLLEAAHIVPWSKATPEQKRDVRNGLLLCSVHHKLFDRGYFVVDSNFMLRYGDLSESRFGPYSGQDKSVTLEIHGNKINLPRRTEYYPSTESIKWHRDHFAPRKKRPR